MAEKQLLKFVHTIDYDQDFVVDALNDESQIYNPGEDEDGEGSFLHVPFLSVGYRDVSNESI